MTALLLLHSIPSTQSPTQQTARPLLFMTASAEFQQNPQRTQREGRSKCSTGAKQQLPRSAKYKLFRKVANATLTNLMIYDNFHQVPGSSSQQRHERCEARGLSIQLHGGSILNGHKSFRKKKTEKETMRF